MVVEWRKRKKNFCKSFLYNAKGESSLMLEYIERDPCCQMILERVFVYSYPSAIRISYGTQHYNRY
jgi:hypothetical protein